MQSNETWIYFCKCKLSIADFLFTSKLLIFLFLLLLEIFISDWSHFQRSNCQCQNFFLLPYVWPTYSTILLTSHSNQRTAKAPHNRIRSSAKLYLTTNANMCVLLSYNIRHCSETHLYNTLFHSAQFSNTFSDYLQYLSCIFFTILYLLYAFLIVFAYLWNIFNHEHQLSINNEYLLRNIESVSLM